MWINIIFVNAFQQRYLRSYLLILYFSCCLFYNVAHELPLAWLGTSRLPRKRTLNSYVRKQDNIIVNQGCLTKLIIQNLYCSYTKPFVVIIVPHTYIQATIGHDNIYQHKINHCQLSTENLNTLALSISFTKQSETILFARPIKNKSNAFSGCKSQSIKSLMCCHLSAGLLTLRQL